MESKTATSPEGSTLLRADEIYSDGKFRIKEKWGKINLKTGEIIKKISRDIRTDKLNLGCGNRYEEGWINCDVSKKVKADFYFDCGKVRFPFKDNSFNEVKAERIFEHLPDYEARVHLLKEIHRVSKKGGKVFLSVPHFSSQGAWGDLQHNRPFTSMSLDYFAVNKTHKYSIMHSQEIEGDNKLFFVKPKIIFGKIHRLVGISLFANNPKTRLIYEMFFAYIFPARELHFELEVVK